MDDYKANRIGFDIECSTGYKVLLHDAASTYIDQLIMAENRVGTPMTPDERIASAARLDSRRQRQVRLIAALPDVLPAKAVSLTSGAPYGALAQVVLRIDSRGEVDDLFEKLVSVPLVHACFQRSNHVESQHIEDGHYSRRLPFKCLDLPSVRQETLSSIEPIAPFFWRHQLHAKDVWTNSVLWYTEFVDDQGTFMAMICVDVADDDAHFVLDSPPVSFLKGQSGEVQQETSPKNHIRVIGAPEDGISEFALDRRTNRGILNLYWPASVHRPSDVFGQV